MSISLALNSEVWHADDNLNMPSVYNQGAWILTNVTCSFLKGVRVQISYQNVTLQNNLWYLAGRLNGDYAYVSINSRSLSLHTVLI